MGTVCYVYGGLDCAQIVHALFPVTDGCKTNSLSCCRGSRIPIGNWTSPEVDRAPERLSDIGQSIRDLNEALSVI